MWRFMHPDDVHRSTERIRDVMQTDEPNEFEECCLIDINGNTIDVEASSTRIRNYPGRGTVVQSVFRDIRGRKKEEEALIHSEKLSVAGQMAAGIAHEIRNPLTSLIGFSKFLKTKIDKYHEYFDYKQTARKGKGKGKGKGTGKGKGKKAVLNLKSCQHSSSPSG
nr:histidine kinase dimerization/phospho-acceptor domain-containing protein [Paenibacillus taihuensis]